MGQSGCRKQRINSSWPTKYLTNVLIVLQFACYAADVLCNITQE